MAEKMYRLVAKGKELEISLEQIARLQNQIAYFENALQRDKEALDRVVGIIKSQHFTPGNYELTYEI